MNETNKIERSDDLLWDPKLLVHLLEMPSRDCVNLVVGMCTDVTGASPGEFTCMTQGDSGTKKPPARLLE